MAFTFRRTRHAVPPVRELLESLPSGWTGAVDVEHEGAAASIFLFEGGVYAAAISGFHPGVARRLASSGFLSAGLVDEWQQIAASGQDPQTSALDEGWCSLDQLNLVHQEFVIATVGAIVALESAHCETRSDDATSVGCCLPLPEHDLIDLLDRRAERLARESTDLATMAPTGVWHQASMPESGPLEVRSLVAAFAEPRTVDSAAGACGFTRAEAVHLAGVAARQGNIAPTDTPVTPASFSPVIDVPEAWPASA